MKPGASLRGCQDGRAHLRPAQGRDRADGHGLHAFLGGHDVREGANDAAAHRLPPGLELLPDRLGEVLHHVDPARPRGRGERTHGVHPRLAPLGRIYAPSIFFAQSASPVSPYDKLPDIEGNRDDYDIVGFDCQPGDVIVHHVMTVHGSGGNLSRDRGRAAMSFRYCGDDIRYFDKPGAIEQQYLQGQLENGDRLHGPDYPLVHGLR